MRRRSPTVRLIRTACSPPAWCVDCGEDTTPCTVARRRGERACPRHYGWEYYMVQADAWASADGPTHARGFLCIGCLERRLGRALTAADFPDVMLNAPGYMDSARLLSRKLAGVA